MKRPEESGCAMLRSAAESGRPASAPLDAGPEAFWCLKTTRNVGPDGHFVHPGECTSARTCFEVEAEAAGPRS